MQRLGNLTGYTLDTAHSFHIQFLRWELNGGITRVNTSKLNMLGDGICQDLTFLRYGVHLYLLSMFYEL